MSGAEPWVTTTAAQAEETGAQAKAAVAAYEAAFAMTVPPPVIAANRALLLALIATNFFGQNTPAIMATEAQYMEMWAQDAAAMYGYQAAAQAASVLSPFTVPAPTTGPRGWLSRPRRSPKPPAPLRVRVRRRWHRSSQRCPHRYFRGVCTIDHCGGA